MCGTGDPVGISNMDADVEARSRHVASVPAWKSEDVMRMGAPGFLSYGAVAPGDKVLIAVTNQYDLEIIDSVSKSLKEKGAKRVDILIVDEGEADRELAYDDEIKQDIRTEPWWVKPRRYDFHERICSFAKANGYDFVLHGRLFSPFDIDYKFEPFPFQTKEAFLGKAIEYPRELNYLVNKKVWELIYKKGRGGKVTLTDPEGTHLEFTLHEKYFERHDTYSHGGFGPKPLLGHLFGHPTPPIIPEADTVGTIGGTTSHITRPFPQIKLEVEQGRVESVKGGGEYGKGWGELLERTRDIQYPEFPRKGLFWLWEAAIGTNPHVKRLSNAMRLHSESFFWDVYRSGVMHLGIGTGWYDSNERFAAERGLPYGHLHVHILFPTYRIRTKGGEDLTVIENGRLTPLDDPEVVQVAKKYGDPERLLKEVWIPKIPGINTDGAYEDYAKDPAEWIKKFG